MKKQKETSSKRQGRREIEIDPAWRERETFSVVRVPSFADFFVSLLFPGSLEDDDE